MKNVPANTWTPASKRARAACFTYWFTDDEIKKGHLSMPNVEDAHDCITYYIAQRELSKNGEPHLQGYMEFDTPIGLSKARSILPANWGPRWSTQKNAINYCKKEASFDNISTHNGKPVEAGPWEWGTPKQQGARNDIKKVVELISNGASDADLLTKAPAYLLRYGKGIDRMRLAAHPTKPTFRKVHTLVIWGNPGVGKSRYARQIDPELYSMWKDTGEWFDGYSGQKTLLIDEFKCAPSITMMNTILDGYHQVLPIKGGTTYARWTLVIIISNLDPAYWYSSEPSALRQALYRRLGNIRRMDDIGGLGVNTGSCKKEWNIPTPAWTILSPPDEDDEPEIFRVSSRKGDTKIDPTDDYKKIIVSPDTSRREEPERPGSPTPSEVSEYSSDREITDPFIDELIG